MRLLFRASRASLAVVLLASCGQLAAASTGAPPVARVAITPAVDSASRGDTLTLSASAIAGGSGNPIKGAAVTWGVNAPLVAKLVTLTTTGRARVILLDTGTVAIDATSRGVTGRIVLRVRARPPAPVDTATRVTATTIALAVQRFDTGGTATGPALVTTGIPLRCGALMPGQELQAHVTLDGTELPLYAAPLASRCRDGSARALLVQFRVAALTTPRPATLTLGGLSRTGALLLAAPLARPGSDGARGTAPLGLPQAAALPTSTSYLLSTDLVGATISSDSATKLGGAFARYEADFKAYADTMWKYAPGPTWNDGNYYDRALVYTAAWVRSANPVYWARAAQQAAAYRDGYLVPGGYSASAHWSLLEGLEKHYLLTGDEASRVAVVMTANRLTNLLPEYYGPISGDAREMGRYILASLLAWRLTPPGVPAPAWSMQSGFNPIPDWNAYLDTITAKALAWQTAAGTWPSDGICKGQLNYMVAILNTALIKAYEQWKPDPKIQDAVKRSADYLMTTQWRPEANAFNYANVVCTTGSPDPAADLGGFFVDAYGWLYKRTGDAKYRTFGEQAFAASVGGAYLWGGKQFNQQYHTSFRYLGYR